MIDGLQRRTAACRLAHLLTRRRAELSKVAETLRRPRSSGRVMSFCSIWGCPPVFVKNHRKIAASSFFRESLVNCAEHEHIAPRPMGTAPQLTHLNSRSLDAYTLPAIKGDFEFFPRGTRSIMCLTCGHQRRSVVRTLRKAWIYELPLSSATGR